MNTLRIDFRDDCREFTPGGEVAGTVQWDVDKAPGSAELRLVWFTRGQGIGDSALVDTVRFENVRANDSRSFSLILPAAPYSFSGKLITLVWALELVLKPGKSFQREEITMSPTGAAIVLPQGPAPGKTGLGRFLGKS